MTWAYKQIYYGEKTILNRTRVKELIYASSLVEPFMFFDDWFRYFKLEGDAYSILENLKKPMPDLLLCQKPEGRFALHLSAGIDSSFLAFLYDNNKNADYIVGTVKGANNHEYAGAKELMECAKLKGELHEVSISPEEAFEAANKILPVLPEPVMDPAIVLSYLVSKKAKELGHSLVVSGDGADVAFGDPSPFGMKALKTFGILKTSLPAELLNLKSLLPYSHPEVQIFGSNRLNYSQRSDKSYIRDLARSLGMPPQVIYRKKTGWVGHEAWCTGSIYEEMERGIKTSPFYEIFHRRETGKANVRKRKKEPEILFRKYALIKWLEANCNQDVRIIDGEPCNSLKRRKTDKNQLEEKRWRPKWVMNKLKTCITEKRLPNFINRWT